jgi:hypothetical protein
LALAVLAHRTAALVAVTVSLVKSVRTSVSVVEVVLVASAVLVTPVRDSPVALVAETHLIAELVALAYPVKASLEVAAVALTQTLVVVAAALVQ